jgi:hypothetical protein
MALPLLLVGAAVALGGFGLKKGFDAKKIKEEAERIGRRAARRHDVALSKLNIAKEDTNKRLAYLGQLKAKVFSNQIKYLVDAIRKNKAASSKLAHFQEGFSDVELVRLDSNIKVSLELTNGLGTGTVAGALAAYGAYSGVGMLATASTGTAISTLGGAAATNATLAWLGGGSLASGGLGIAGGTAVLGGLVIGPALAIGGFMMASKAEEALTKAKEYEAEIDVAIAKIEKSIVLLHAVQENVEELSNAIIKMALIFDSVKTGNSFFDSIIDYAKNIGIIRNDLLINKDKFEKMIAVGISLKKILSTPVLNENGKAVPYLKKTISGYLEY